ncbi:rhodanese-like domain-containing protein [Paludibacterium yongneupense]|uniref:rhodanese-like domain-containing protein n=1 Tax=Paludibacterium yongneupense TaxID=400061 RepID=UPI0004177841|nr:rhodanese-like domain-containing protein [Paludibacterium yongneupense]
MPGLITPADLQTALHDGKEIALFDIREQGEFGESHLFFAVALPYSRMELDVTRLAPRRDVRVVLYGREGELALRAARRLEQLGYERVSVLDGGVAAWSAAGHPLFAGVNVPSKAFGELAEHACETPSVDAATLAGWLAGSRPPLLLDGRPLDEFARMSIPGARCCPNGELAYRIRDLVTDDMTPVVINCAGRTRSIIGAQTLINLGLKNPVYALENGTQGWMLADFDLDHGADARYPEVLSQAARDWAIEAADRVAHRFSVSRIDAKTARLWLNETVRTTYLLDVRTPEEFAASTLSGAQHAPGGQLIQATDQFVGVRGARLLLFDNGDVRAVVAASWLRQLGYEAHVLVDGVASDVSAPPTAQVALPAVPSLTVAALRQGREQGTLDVVDIRSSAAYRRSHIPGAVWSIRPRLAELSSIGGAVVLVADSAQQACLAAGELAGRQVYRLDGGFAAWLESGLPLESSPQVPPDSERIDFLFFTHDRHDGNKQAARQYLDWEVGLLAQLDERDRAVFRPGDLA